MNQDMDILQSIRGLIKIVRITSTGIIPPESKCKEILQSLLSQIRHREVIEPLDIGTPEFCAALEAGMEKILNNNSYLDPEVDDVSTDFGSTTSLSTDLYLVRVWNRVRIILKHLLRKLLALNAPSGVVQYYSDYFSDPSNMEGIILGKIDPPSS